MYCDNLGNNTYNIMSIGNVFQAIMHLKDGTTLPAVNASGNGNYSHESGWFGSSNTAVKQVLEFDFKNVLLRQPVGTTTDYIEFITNPSQVKALVINGLVVKKN